MKKLKPGAKPKYKVQLRAICVRVADIDRDKIKSLELELQKKHLKVKS